MLAVRNTNASRCDAGNFNPTSGRCTCPLGRSGARCELHVLDACRATPSSSAVACVVRRPQPCECVKQCLAHGAFAAHMYRVCFTYPSGRELSTLSSHASFFEWIRPKSAAAAEEVTRLTLKPITTAKALAVDFRPHLRHVAPHHCPSRCSDRGACQRGRNGGAAFCNCDPHYLGRACERHDGHSCWNGCSGRGECVDGFCVCTPPYYGPGCALGGERPAGSLAAAEGVFRIFVRASIL